MKNYLSTIKLFCTLSVLFLLCGCSIQTNIYVQNLTDEMKVVSIKYKRRFAEIKRPYHELKYIDRIEPVKFFKPKNENKLKVLEQKVNDSMIVLNLPPRSTSRIEQTSNYNWHSTIEYVEIDDHKYSIEELDQKLGSVKNEDLLKIE